MGESSIREAESHAIPALNRKQRLMMRLALVYKNNPTALMKVLRGIEDLKN